MDDKTKDAIAANAAIHYRVRSVPICARPVGPNETYASLGILHSSPSDLILGAGSSDMMVLWDPKLEYQKSLMSRSEFEAEYEPINANNGNDPRYGVDNRTDLQKAQDATAAQAGGLAGAGVANPGGGGTKPASTGATTGSGSQPAAGPGGPGGASSTKDIK